MNGFRLFKGVRDIQMSSSNFFKILDSLKNNLGNV